MPAHRPGMVFAPLSPPSIEDPYPAYRALRATDPVFWHEPIRSWVVLDYSSALRVLRDDDLFARDWRRVGQAVPADQLSVQNLDPPESAPMRSRVLGLFQRKEESTVRAEARSATGSRLEAAHRQGEFDFIQEVALPVSLLMTSSILGVAVQELDELDALSDPIVLGMDAGLDPSRAAGAKSARDRLCALVSAWCAGRATSDGVDLLFESGGRAAVDRTVVENTVRVIALSIFAATSAAIGNGVLALLRERGSARLDSAADTTAAVDELIRFDGPVHVVSRVSCAEVELGGARISRGEDVAVVLGSANRDPERFGDPDRLVLDRSPNRHLGMSWGAHACLGPGLARAAVGGVLEGVADSGADLAATGPATRMPTATMRKLKRLPVNLVPAP